MTHSGLCVVVGFGLVALFLFLVLCLLRFFEWLFYHNHPAFLALMFSFVLVASYLWGCVFLFFFRR